MRKEKSKADCRCTYMYNVSSLGVRKGADRWLDKQTHLEATPFKPLPSDLVGEGRKAYLGLQLFEF